jgi:hypothetical protein
MTPKLQTLIDTAQELSPLEQVELIQAVSQLLYRHYQKILPSTDFWQPLTLEQIVQTQQVPPVSDVSALQADFWPKEESADDFIEYVYQQRAEDRLDNQ